MEKTLDLITGHFPVRKEEMRAYSALSLAYIGDSVYDLIIKTMLVTRGHDRPNHYHRKAVDYVSAAAQTMIMNRIRPLLNEEEKTIFRRGRNSKTISPAKNQSHHDYRIATGFEALVGYLYLTGQRERMLELITEGISVVESDEEPGSREQGE